MFARFIPRTLFAKSRRITQPALYTSAYRSFSTSDSTKPRTLTGLGNMDKNCYMNSTLQCLFYTPLFTGYFLDDDYEAKKRPENSGIAQAFVELLYKVRDQDLSTSDLSEPAKKLKDLILERNPLLAEQEQNDAHEFLKALQQGIHDDLNRMIIKPPYRELTINPELSVNQNSDEWFKYMLARENSIVTDIFCGQLLNKTKCTTCKNESLSFDNFWDLSLAFPPGTKSNRLNDMLEYFFKEEEVDGLCNCEKCKEKREVTKKFLPWRLPRILTIHLKRYEYNELRKQKVNNPVTFPVHLDIGKLAGESKQPSAKDGKYTLFGIINHEGSLNEGHYTAECRDPYDGKWYKFDDADVSEVSIKEKELESDSAYILFYVKSAFV